MGRAWAGQFLKGFKTGVLAATQTCKAHGFPSTTILKIKSATKSFLNDAIDNPIFGSIQKVL